MRRFGFFLALRLPVRYGRSAAIAGCGSSVVEHSLGKGEVESSILSRSTSLPCNCRIGQRLTMGLAPTRGNVAPARPRGGMVHAEDCKSFTPGSIPGEASSSSATIAQPHLPVRPRSRPIAPVQLVTCDSRRPASSGASAMPSSAKRYMSSKSSSCSKTTPPTLIASTSLSPFGAK